MKRDMDLCRAVLQQIEQKPPDYNPPMVLRIEAYSNAEIGYHVLLLHEAGLLYAEQVPPPSPMPFGDWKPFRLTWQGHEFLEVARNDTLWQKAKNIVLEKVGSLSFEALKLTLTDLLKSAVLSR